MSEPPLVCGGLGLGWLSHGPTIAPAAADLPCKEGASTNQRLNPEDVDMWSVIRLLPGADFGGH